jgi:hypothetical protein
MRKLVLIIGGLVLSVCSSAVAAPQPVCKVLPQPEAPVQIAAYTCGYQPGGQYTTEGIRHSLEYKNNGSNVVEAVQIGLVSFDVWNEFLDRTNGIALERLTPSMTKKGTWVARAYSDFAFLTGVAYLAKARFSDGTIWKADLDTIGAAMREIEANFDVERLKEREKPDSK